MTSSGALRFGQCPVASKTVIRLSGILRVTNSPTCYDAMMSLLHWRIRAKTVTSVRSLRLSEVKVTRANALAISVVDGGALT